MEEAGVHVTAERAPQLSVDVVIPVKNRPRLIVACLDSVRAQSLQPNRVIVVDDGSTDETPSVLHDYARRWAKLHVILSEPAGVSHARNLGIAACRAPLVAFLDSDDVWHPQKLERQIALFTPDRPELGFVYCANAQIGEFEQEMATKPLFIPTKRGDIFNDMLNKSYHITGSASSMVARRELVAAVGGFDLRLVQAEDVDLCLRLARVAQADYVSEVLVGQRRHAASSYAQALRTNRELVLLQRLAIWNKWLGDIDEVAVLTSFRRQAFAVVRQNALRPVPDFGLYRRLKNSELTLAGRVFPSFGFYVKHILGETFPRFRHAYRRVKGEIATRCIMRSNRLLRLCQAFGKLRNVSIP